MQLTLWPRDSRGRRTRLIAHAILLAVAFGPALVRAAVAVEAPCHVGLEVRTVFDSSRAYDGQARPIRIVLWYPASISAASPLTLSGLVAADWISASHASSGWSDLPAARRELVARLTEMRSRVSVEQALGIRWCAGLLTPARPGRFPLVLIGSGLTARAYYHAQLAQDLAQAGFVVAFVGGLGPTPDATPGLDIGSLETLKHDAVRALLALAGDERVDATRVGLVAWSVAGVVQLALATDLPSVRAAVSLDSGVGYNYGPSLWTGAGGGRPRTMPYLHLAAGVRSSVPADDALLKQIGADIQVMRALSHAQFTDLPLGDGAGTRVAQAAMRRTVVDFLVNHVAR